MAAAQRDTVAANNAAAQHLTDAVGEHMPLKQAAIVRAACQQLTNSDGSTVYAACSAHQDSMSTHAFEWAQNKLFARVASVPQQARFETAAD